MVAFYPWMTVRQTLDYTASFRSHWSRKIEAELLDQFDLDPSKKVSALSKGMKSQISLICAVCAEPEMLVLDEPTSGLDPIVRREFIKTVIGAYQEGSPDHRTIFVSTHLIGEFEGLIDEFTIIERGKDILSLDADTARERFKRIRLRFPEAPPDMKGLGVKSVSIEGREAELVTDKYSEEIKARLESLSPESLVVETLSLEEIFIVTAGMKGNQI